MTTLLKYFTMRDLNVAALKMQILKLIQKIFFVQKLLVSWQELIQINTV